MSGVDGRVVVRARPFCLVFSSSAWSREVFRCQSPATTYVNPLSVHLSCSLTSNAPSTARRIPRRRAAALWKLQLTNGSAVCKIRPLISTTLDKLLNLQKELDGVMETESEMNSLMEHAETLQQILASSQKRKHSFSSISRSELTALGVTKQFLTFAPESVARLVDGTIDGPVMQSLYTHLTDIHDHVNTSYEPASRMRIDAILLAVAKMAPSGKDVGIFPEMRLATDDGVKVTNPITKYTFWLAGTVDYGVFQYSCTPDAKARLLGDNGYDQTDIYRFSRGCLFLVEAKRRNDHLGQFLPEALSQAIVLGEESKNNFIRFVLSDGRTWMFFVYKKGADGNRVYYESAARKLVEEEYSTMVPEKWKRSICEVVQLLLKWLDPEEDQNNLYTLDVE